jgi:phosphoribosyl 1,2-cyclic phosphodiesterase
MRIATLGSGSRGNATFLEAGGTRVLVDAGFSGREIESRLGRLGIEADSIEAIVVTHEHGDHTRGIGVFARRFGTPLYLTSGTQTACASLLRGGEEVRSYTPGRPFALGALEFHPFLTVHDAVDPVAVTVVGQECRTRVGIATDLGRPTAGIRHALAGCHFLILEANHDEGRLRSSAYPPAVQARIASSHGHLSNHAAARFAVELLHPELLGVRLAHLSAECNDPATALEVVGSALRDAGYSGFLDVALQDDPSPLLDLAKLRRELGRGPGRDLGRELGGGWPLGQTV